MSLIEHLGTLSSLLECAGSLQLVTQFKYLGVQVTTDPSKDLELMFQQFQAKCNLWCKLPLSVIGRGNLIKIVWSSQLHYILHNSSQWILADGLCALKLYFEH